MDKREIADKLRKMVESFKEKPTAEQIAAKLKEIGLEGEVKVLSKDISSDVMEMAADIAKFSSKQLRKAEKRGDMFAKPKIVSALSLTLVAAATRLGCPPEYLIDNFLKDVEQAFPGVECKHTTRREGESERAPVGFLGKPIEC